MSVSLRSRAHGPRAFTLIELLVVVAIIALLIAILLPVLGRTRESARVVMTLGRLRDLGIGVASYSNDFRGALPVLADEEEKAFLGLSAMAKYNDTPPEAFVNPNTLDEPTRELTEDLRPALVTIDGRSIEDTDSIDESTVRRLAWHCSYAYDNDEKPRRRGSERLRVYLGDRADYETGTTFSANWGGRGQCVVFTDQHAEFLETRSVAHQDDPNIYHHNEWEGEGADEVRDEIRVIESTLDTHLRFFSEEEDDELLPN